MQNVLVVSLWFKFSVSSWALELQMFQEQLLHDKQHICLELGQTLKTGLQMPWNSCMQPAHVTMFSYHFILPSTHLVSVAQTCCFLPFLILQRLAHMFLMHVCE